MIDIENLTKSFGNTVAVNNLKLNVAKGEIYCLLGANGAGKTTTINSLLNLVQLEGGSAKIGGMNVADEPLKTKEKLTYIPENLSLYPSLSGIENLRFFCGLSGIKLSDSKAVSYLKEAGLQVDAAHKRVGGYSKGMRQKVGIALAIARSSEVLLLDEPTSGLDPAASSDFATLLTDMKERGAAVLMATHDLFRAKETGTKIGIMNRGSLVDELNAADVTHSDLEKIYLNHMRA